VSSDEWSSMTRIVSRKEEHEFQTLLITFGILALSLYAGIINIIRAIY